MVNRNIRELNENRTMLLCASASENLVATHGTPIAQFCSLSLIDHT